MHTHTLRMLDSMNLWIDIARPLLVDVLRRVDLVVLNDGEVRMLADDANLVRAAQWLHGELQPAPFLWSSEASTACLPSIPADCFMSHPCLRPDLWTPQDAGTVSPVHWLLTSPRERALWDERSCGLGSSMRPLWRVSPCKALA